MTSKTEKERAKAQQEKFQAVLSDLLKDEDNKYCVDCDAKGPRWASWNLGVFLCIRCAGIHRNLGVHISKVKSVNLDQWTPEQVAMMMEMGNSRARAVYEANIPDGFRRPAADSRSLETFIRTKYEQKKYIAREWVPPKPFIPKELEIDDKAEKRKSKAKQSSVSLNSTPAPPKAKTEEKVETTSKKAEEIKKSPPPPAKNSSDDLLGLDMSPSKSAPAGQSTDLLGELGDFMSAPSQQVPYMSPQSSAQSSVTPSQAQQNGSMEANLFDDTATGDKKPDDKSKKDSIMALFGPATSQPQQQQQFGVPVSSMGVNYATPMFDMGITSNSYYDQGGMYIPTTGRGGQGMYNMGTGMPPQQQAMGMPTNMPTNMQANVSQGMNMYGQQGMVQQQPMYNMMPMSQPGPMMGMPQGNPAMTQATMPIYNQHHYQYQQMQQQMSGMRIGGGNMMGNQPMGSQGGAMNWNPQSSATGHTLSTNLWQ